MTDHCLTVNFLDQHSISSYIFPSTGSTIIKPSDNSLYCMMNPNIQQKVGIYAENIDFICTIKRVLVHSK